MAFLWVVLVVFVDFHCLDSGLHLLALSGPDGAELSFLGTGCGYHNDNMFVAMQASWMKKIRWTPSAIRVVFLKKIVNSVVNSAIIHPRHGIIVPTTTLIR